MVTDYPYSRFPEPLEKVPSGAGSMSLDAEDQSTVAQTQRLPAAVGGPAAVNRQSMTVNEAAGLIVSKKRHSAGYIVRRSKTPHRHAAGDVGIGVAAACLIRHVHFGFHPA